ncbi:MAG: rod shape-determining protein MreC [Nitrospiraceae bacterium]|nr:rod shape-determining protein MreC [Nitrospiraceae bacterium]
MPGFFEKNKKHLFIVAAFLILFWLLTYQVKAGRFTLLERPVLAVSGFVERIVTGTYNGILSVGRGYVFLVRTERENRRLQDEVNRLRLENQITTELLSENERLRSALAFAKKDPLRSVMAQVIAKESTPVSSTYTVNKGASDGIERDQPVYSPDGVVGRVQAVLGSTAKIQLLTDPGNTIAVRVLRNREEGLLEGKLDRCALKYVSYYVDVQEGDLLVTSGLDAIYPKGLPVAVVTEVKKHEASSFQTVYARPVVSLARIEEVLVLKK